MINFIKQSMLFSLVFLIALFSYSDQIEIMQREGLFGKSFTVKVPTNADGEMPPITVIREGDGNSQRIFFSTVVPREQRRKLQQPESEGRLNNPIASILFKDLQFIVDGSGQKIAAAYPFIGNRQILVTALHALQNAQFENRAMNEKKLWGLKDAKTEELLDIVFVSEIANEQILKAELSSLVDIDDTIKSGTVDHLNVVDTNRELILSNSKIQITSSNQDYIFYQNSSNAMIGYASSGAVINNAATGRAHSIVICASKVPLNRDETTLRNRALKLEVIHRYQLIELTPELINGFQKLPCDPQDGRGAGGP